MAKFKVLRPIELEGTLYLPEGSEPPKKPKSCGNGVAVNTDMSGVIELEPETAALMTLGQIAPVPAPAVKKTEGKKQKAEG